MRVLVISHAAVVPANQALYCELERRDGVRLALVVPRQWRASMGGVTAFARHERLESDVVERKVRFSGSVNLHYYPGLSLRALPFLPDVVYADEDPYSLAAYQALQLARSVRAAFVFKSNQNLLKRYPPPFRWTEGAVLHEADAAIAIAPACAEVLRAKGFEGIVEVIGHSVDPGAFRRRESGSLRAELGLEGFVIGYMGRLAPEKGVRDLVEAWARVRAHDTRGGGHMGPPLLVGDGPQRKEVERLVAERGGAVFTGAVAHGRAAEYLGCMDVLVVPSRTTPRWKEQFGRVIIEAMACGVPVIGSDSGNIPVLIEETGGGVTYPEGDVARLAAELGRFTEAPEEARRVGEAGRRVVLERYTHEAISARIAEVLWRAEERRAVR